MYCGISKYQLCIFHAVYIFQVECIVLFQNKLVMDKNGNTGYDIEAFK